VRLFLFTSEDNPHPHGSTEREQAINHAKKLAAEDIQIELFPLKQSPTSRFDLRKFYVEIVTLDPEEINEAVLDTSDKVMDLQHRLRQK
jgi:ATP-dependent DNA helicase 2 subunit 1